MAYKAWKFELEGQSHIVELEHGYWSGRRLIRIDGQVTDRRVKFCDTGSSHRFEISGHECVVRVVYRWSKPLSFSYECTIDGELVPTAKSLISESGIESAVIETHRSEEKIGTERRVIDNSKSSASLSRRFTLSKEWFQAYKVDNEKSRVIRGELNVGIGSTLGVKSVAETKIRTQYSVSENIRQICTDEVTIEVPPKTALEILFQWKRIWQHGFVRVQDNQTDAVEIPFQIAVGITFDQMQADI